MQQQNSAFDESEEMVDWRDSQIRWENDSTVRRPNLPNKGDVDVDDTDDEECNAMDLFAPDPRATFSFTFACNDKGKEEQIDITLQGYTYESDQTWSSTGLTLWRASEFLCRYLVNHWHQDEKFHGERDEISKPRRILELGAGLGLCGIVAHHLSSKAGSVFVTDGDTDALVKLRENVALNKRQNGHISSHQLLWGRDTAERFLHKVAADQNFDIILAADVVYVQSVVVPLWETVDALLCPDHDRKAVFILAFARRMLEVTVEDVLQAADRFNFDYELCATQEEVEKGLFLYIFRRRK